MTLSIANLTVTLGIMTFNKMHLIVIYSISDSQHNDMQHKLKHSVELTVNTQHMNFVSICCASLH